MSRPAEGSGLQPWPPRSYPIRRSCTGPEVRTLTTDSTTTGAGAGAGADAEAADVALAQSGDGRAFERLYRAHVARVHGLMRRMMDAAEADDMTQDVFVRAWEKLHTFRGEAAFGTWLHRLAVNVALARRKTLAIERGRHDRSEAPLERIATRRETPEHRVDFEEAIRRLPDGSRQVFLLHDVAGYRHEEIARLLGIVAGTSKSQLHHARMALRKHLER